MHFVRKTVKPFFCTVFEAKIAPHNPRVQPTDLEWQKKSVIEVQKIRKKSRSNKEKQKKEKEKKRRKKKKDKPMRAPKQRCPKHRKASGNQARPKIGLKEL